MKSAKTRPHFILLLSTALLLILPFQNCGKSPLEFEDSFVSSSFSYFGYKYQEASPYYVDIKVIPQAATGSAREILIVGGIAASDGSVADISYGIEVLNENGTRICPILQGNLSGGQTLVEQNCATTVSYQAHELRYSVTFEGVTTEYSENLGGI